MFHLFAFLRTLYTLVWRDVASSIQSVNQQLVAVNFMKGRGTKLSGDAARRATIVVRYCKWLTIKPETGLFGILLGWLLRIIVSVPLKYPVFCRGNSNTITVTNLQEEKVEQVEAVAKPRKCSVK